jgi:cytochrome subunit of sulfide dehydrogenase
MKISTFKYYVLTTMVGMSAMFHSCTKNVAADKHAEPPPGDNMTATAASVSPELQGRALASNCFQCHGTNGHASELKIAGIDASGLMSKFTEMRARGARDNIMNVHAFGYTNEEIQLIGNFFSKQ